MNQTKDVFMVGISGASASGKSWLINELSKNFEENITVISQDNYYKPIEELAKDKNGMVNFDLPETLFLDQLLADLNSLKSGKSISRLSYHFNNPDIKREILKIHPKKIIITEGIFIFHHPQIFELFDLKIYLEADEEIKYKRRVDRDERERATSKEVSAYQWNEHVKPAFQKYIEPYKHKADIVVDNNGTENNWLQTIIKILNKNV